MVDTNSCRHTWLKMEHVREDLTKIVCKDCNKVMGIWQQEEMKGVDHFRRTINFTIESNHVEMPKIDELLEDIMKDAKEIKLDHEILARIYSQDNNDKVSGKVRELTDEERDELR